MSKLSFRARALDASKPMPIYLAEELPDLPDYSAINRAVPQMPSGMEKEEESEHHLQRAISGTGLIIPTPEVCPVSDLHFYERCYPPDYKMPKQHIHMQPLWEEQEAPEYDMDSEDERWLRQQRHPDLTELLFEQMMDRLEKSSGQTVVTLSEAKLLLQRADDLVIAVYDYWLNKRLTLQHPLILSVKTESRPGQSSNNPYLAFRRRTEKMQTRKNRKNDESSYEKMLKLRRELARALALLQLVARREQAKRELVALTGALADRRYRARDYSEPPPQHPTETQNHHRTVYAPTTFRREPFTVQQFAPPIDSRQREKRPYKRRKHRHHVAGAAVGGASGGGATPPSLAPASSSSDDSGPRDDPGPFAFRRKQGCYYQLPTSTLCGDPVPGADLFEHELDPRHRYTLVSVGSGCVGFARRRAGRGGRLLLDRRPDQLHELWPLLPAPPDHTQEEPSDSMCYRSPKETWRDYTHSQYPWRKAFRRHLAKNPHLWIEEPPDVKLGLDDVKNVFDDVKLDLDDVKVDLDDVKMDIDSPKSERSPSPGEAEGAEGAEGAAGAGGDAAHALDAAARAALRKRLHSASDSSVDEDEPLAPAERTFRAFIQEVNADWLHFRPAPAPSPPPPAPEPALAADAPFAVELFPALADPFLTEPLTLERLRADTALTEAPSPPPAPRGSSRVSVRARTPPAVPSPAPAPRAPPPPPPPAPAPPALAHTHTPGTPPKTPLAQTTKSQSPPKKLPATPHSEHKEKPRSQEKVERPAPSPVPNSNIIVEEVNEVPHQIKIDKKKTSETLEEVVLAHGVQLKTVQTKHSPLKKHIITSRAAGAGADGAPLAPAPHILTVAVSDTLKVRLQNHLVSTAGGQSGAVTISSGNGADGAGGSGTVLGLVNSPFQPRPRHQHTVGSVASGHGGAGAGGATVAGAAGVAGAGARRPVVRPVHLAPSPLAHPMAHAHAQHAPAVSTPVVLAPSHTIHHVAPNKLKVLHAHPLHPLTHTQRNQLLGGRGSIAQLPAVVSLGGGQALIKGTNALTQFIEIKGAPLGKGPHLVNVVRSMAPHAHTHVSLPPHAHAKPRADLHDPKRRQLVFGGDALKGNIQAVPRPHRVSVSVEARGAVAGAAGGGNAVAVAGAGAAAVRAPHVRHQIQLKGRALVGGAGAPGSGAAAAAGGGAKTAALSQAVVANLLHKNVQLPKGGQKIAIGSAYSGVGVGVGGVGGSVQALALSGAQLKARAARLHPPAHHIEVGESGAGASTSGAANADDARRNNDTLPMEVT